MRLRSERSVDDIGVEKVVQEEGVRKLAEDKDVESRRRNVIICRVPEKVSDTYDERKLVDKQYLLDLFDIIFQIKVKDEDIQKCFDLVECQKPPIALTVQYDHCLLALVMRRSKIRLWRT